MGVRLDDSSVTSATPGVLVKGEVDPTLTALALNVVSGTNSSRRVSDQIDTSYLVSGATAYWTGLQLLTDGGMTLSLAATATESGISSGPQLTESAEDSIYIVLFYGNESAVWEFSHLDESDETERYVFSSTSVSAAGPENNSALRSAINDDSSVIVMLVDGSHANINIDALATSTVGVEIRLDSLSELETVFDRAQHGNKCRSLGRKNFRQHSIRLYRTGEPTRLARMSFLKLPMMRASTWRRGEVASRRF